MHPELTGRAISGSTHLLALTGIAAYIVSGALMPPAGYLFYAVLVVNATLLILPWNRSPRVRGHIVQAIGSQVSVLVTELLAVGVFILGTGPVDWLEVSMRDGRLLNGPLAGWNPEVLITWTLAPVFLGLTIHAAWRGYAGKEHQYPLIGRPLAALAARSRRTTA